MSKVFDDNDAIKFIRDFIAEDIKNKYSDNDILLLIDTMFDFFESEDDDDFDEENFDDEAYLNNIVNYVKKNIRKDPDNAIEMDDVKALVVAELEYEATLDDIFDI